MPSAAARAATALARLPVDEQASVAEPELDRLRRRDRDDAILERVRRVRGVELQQQLADAELAREPRRLDERREAGRERIGEIDGRQQVGVAPDAPRPGGDRLVRDAPVQRVPVVDRLERAEAARADAHRFRLVLRLADAAADEIDTHERSR